MTDRAIFVTTDLFEVEKVGEHFINPRCFGQEFAQLLRERLAKEGIETSDPIQEDFGWVLLLGKAPRKLTLSIGILDDSIGRVPAVWRVDLAFEKGLNGPGSWFRKAPDSELISKFALIQSVLSSDSRMRVGTEEPA